MIIFHDGFDHYAQAQSMRKWTASRNAAGLTFTGAGRFGSALDVGQTRWCYKDLGANYSTLIAGFAVAGGDDVPLFSFREGGTTHFQLFMYTTAIVVYRGTGTGSTISFAPFFPISGAFYYFELKGTISDTVGVIRVRVDGADLINDTGLDTRNGGTGVINRIFFGEESGNTFPQFKVDDFVLLDTVDSGVPSNPANDFIGDVRVATIYPNGNGNSSQLVGQDADSTNNYLNVDEGTPDDDTTYNESNVINNQDTYTYQDLPTVTGTVFCVTPIPYVRKNDAGIRKVKTVVRLSAVETVGTEITLSTTYLYFMDIRHADPSGNQWTIANVNALEAGLKVTA